MGSDATAQTMGTVPKTVRPRTPPGATDTSVQKRRPRAKSKPSLTISVDGQRPPPPPPPKSPARRSADSFETGFMSIKTAKTSFESAIPATAIQASYMPIGAEMKIREFTVAANAVKGASDPDLPAAVQSPDSNRYLIDKPLPPLKDPDASRDQVTEPPKPKPTVAVNIPVPVELSATRSPTTAINQSSSEKENLAKSRSAPISTPKARAPVGSETKITAVGPFPKPPNSQKVESDKAESSPWSTRFDSLQAWKSPSHSKPRKHSALSLLPSQKPSFPRLNRKISENVLQSTPTEKTAIKEAVDRPRTAGGTADGKNKLSTPEPKPSVQATMPEPYSAKEVALPRNTSSAPSSAIKISMPERKPLAQTAKLEPYATKEVSRPLTAGEAANDGNKISNSEPKPLAQLATSDPLATLTLTSKPGLSLIDRPRFSTKPPESSAASTLLSDGSKITPEPQATIPTPKHTPGPIVLNGPRSVTKIADPSPGLTPKNGTHSLARLLDYPSSSSPSMSDRTKSPFSDMDNSTQRTTPSTVSPQISTSAVEDAVDTLKDLAQQCENLHARYAKLRAERQKLSSAIVANLNEYKRGPEYANSMLDDQLSLAAVSSSMDICIAKLKSLECRKEDAIATLVALSTAAAATTTAPKKPLLAPHIVQSMPSVVEQQQANPALQAQVHSIAQSALTSNPGSQANTTPRPRENTINPASTNATQPPPINSIQPSAASTQQPSVTSIPQTQRSTTHYRSTPDSVSTQSSAVHSNKSSRSTLTGVSPPPSSNPSTTRTSVSRTSRMASSRALHGSVTVDTSVGIASMINSDRRLTQTVENSPKTDSVMQSSPSETSSPSPGWEDAKDTILESDENLPG